MPNENEIRVRLRGGREGVIQHYYWGSTYVEFAILLDDTDTIGYYLLPDIDKVLN